MMNMEGLFKTHFRMIVRCYKIILISTIMVILSGCIKENLIPERAPEREIVLRTFYLNVSNPTLTGSKEQLINSKLSTNPEFAITTSVIYSDITKAEDLGANENSLENIWILEFDGRLPESKLIVMNYYDTLSGNTFPIVNSNDNIHRIWIIANLSSSDSFDNLILNTTTLSDFESCLIDISEEKFESLIPMTGFDDINTSSSGEFEFQLKRIAAKIVVNYNFTPLNSGDSFTNVTIQIKNVPNFFNVSDCDLSPDITDNSAYFTTYSVSSINSGQTLVWYIPENLRGEVSAITSPVKKSLLMAPMNSTYIEITGDYTKDGVTSRERYNFFLGKNTTTDFNIQRNCRYTININIKDNDEADERLNTPIGITEMSNCYLLNPQSSTTSYALPIGQLNRFWSGVSYGNDPNNVLGDDDTWVAQIIWMDAPDLITLKDNGKGVGGSGKIVVNIEPGKAGNALVGIKRDSDGDGIPDEGAQWLWSWHIWVTDYNPDTPVSIQENKYIYPVQGGNLLRFRDRSLFQNSSSYWILYPNRVIMDRAIGSISNGPYVKENEIQDKLIGAIYFQAGRKDPFPSKVTIYGEQITAKSSTTTLVGSVQNPTIKYNSSLKWCNLSFPNSKLWNDPLVNTDEEYKKSMYDPCPAGWRLPTRNVYIGSLHSNIFYDSDLLQYNYIIPESSEIITLYPAGLANTTAYSFSSLTGIRYQTSTYGTTSAYYSYTMNVTTYREDNAYGAGAYQARCIKDVN